MSKQAEKLQDAIGLVSDEYVEEAHGEAGGATEGRSAGSKDSAGTPFKASVGSGQTDALEGVPTKGDRPDRADRLSDATASPQKRKRNWGSKPVAIAACLVLAVGVGAFALSGTLNGKAAMSASEDVAEGESIGHVDMETDELMSADGATSAKTLDGVAAESASDSLAPGVPQGSLSGGEAEAGVLTAGVWNDNENWPFFTNLVNAGTVEFPSFGIDPRHRVKVAVTDAEGNAVRGEAVVLRDAGGDELWRARSDKDGAAYLFYRDGEEPAKVSAAGVEREIDVSGAGVGEQGGAVRPSDDVTLVVGGPGADPGDLQVMFIVDTTGSMSDEIAYLQADFASIAGDVGSDGVSYSVNFYRDEGDDYVTRCNGFTDDVGAVQELLNAEYADGGGDMPEAVAQVLTETVTENGDWRDGSAKVAFLVFDAPPHEGTEDALDAAVRSAAERGIRLVPVIASNADRETELFGRALSICTDGDYVFLTDDSGVGDSHLEPIVGDYEVEPLHDAIVRIIEESR